MQRVAEACVDRISLKEISAVKAEPVIYNTTEKRQRLKAVHHLERAFRF